MNADRWLSRAVLFSTIIAAGTCARSVQAQTTGTISGVVTDQSGAAVPDVSLRLQQVNTGVGRAASTSPTGDYAFTLILPGTYQITAERSGFATVVIKGVVVQVSSNIRQDISLRVAAAKQELQVRAAAVAVNQETAALGEVITATPIVALPLNGRSFLQLATLTPGAYGPAPGSVAQGLSGGRVSVTVSVSGSRESSSDFLFDGVESKHDFYGAVGLEPPVDSISEFKIQEGYFSPEFGLPGVVNVVIKSGTNNLHGAAWEFLRNDVLDARNFFDVNGINKPPYRQNQFGGNAGGPIRKDKVFFFGDYEGFRVRQGGTSFAKVPTQNQLQGDFTGLPTIYDPSTYDPVTGTAQPFPNNKIPSGNIVAFAKNFNKYIPTPNSAPVAALGDANLFGTTEHILNDNKFDAKIDVARSEKDTFFGRFSFLQSYEDDTSILPGNGEESPLHSRNAVFSWTHVFSPTVVNSFRAGLDRAYLQTFTADNATGPNYPIQLGLKNLNSIPVCNALPAVSISSYAGFGYAFQNCIVSLNTNKIFLDNLAIVRGRHNLSLGGQVLRENLRDIGAFGQTGTFNFTGQYTGDALADYLIGSPQTASGSAPSTPFYYLAWWPQAYFNDDFHVSRKLTLNMGIRWQFTQPDVEKYNHHGYLDFHTGIIHYSDDPGEPRQILNAHHADFAPRFGFAYSPRSNWALRGSYGVFWDRLAGNQKAWGDLLPKYFASYSATGGVHVSGIDMSTLFPSVAGQSQGNPGTYLAILLNDNGRDDPYLQQYTLSVQHTLPSSIFAQIAYVGSNGTHLSTRIDANTAPNPPAPGDNTPLQQRRPFPNLSFILGDEGAGRSWYNSLQATVRKEMSNGLTFLSSYTFAEALDTVGEWGTFSYRWNHLDRGWNPDTPKHRWVTSGLYEVPLGRNYHGLARQAAAGWVINGILTLQSGYPFSVGTVTDQSNTGIFITTLYPNRTCNGSLSGGQRNRLRWFDTNCFALPAQDTFGNAGINYLFGPGSKTLDFAVLKNFPISESRQFQFRFESFNLFNNVNFGNPGSTLGTPGFGIIDSANPARIIQFGLKFLF